MRILSYGLDSLTTDVNFITLTKYLRNIDCMRGIQNLNMSIADPIGWMKCDTTMRSHSSIGESSGTNQTEGSGPNGRNLRPTVNPAGPIFSVRRILGQFMTDDCIRKSGTSMYPDRAISNRHKFSAASTLQKVVGPIIRCRQSGRSRLTLRRARALAAPNRQMENAPIICADCRERSFPQWGRRG